MAFAPMSEQRRTIALLQRKRVTAQREAYKLTLKTLELLDGASADEVAACKSAAATVRTWPWRHHEVAASCTTRRADGTTSLL
jgi:hypothetical protein